MVLLVNIFLFGVLHNRAVEHETRYEEAYSDLKLIRHGVSTYEDPLVMTSLEHKNFMARIQEKLAPEVSWILYFPHVAFALIYVAPHTFSLSLVRCSGRKYKQILEVSLPIGQ